MLRSVVAPALRASLRASRAATPVATQARAFSQMQAFQVYRYDPESGKRPAMVNYDIDLKQCGPMLLDALLKIKDEVDSSLSMRRSCREGICGSCSVNCNGQNVLACLQYIEPSSKAIEVQPLPHTYVVKDLVPDLTSFYSQYKSIEPWLKRREAKPEGTKEFYQSPQDRKLLDGMYECILCACCSTACPSYWWNPAEYYGPAILQQAYRWVADSRDQYRTERLAFLNDTMRLYRCHGIMNCTNCCPKGLDPARSIEYLKAAVSSEYDDSWRKVVADESVVNNDRAGGMSYA